MYLDISQSMKAQRLTVKVNTNIVIWIRDFEQLYKSMVKEASIKHEIIKKVLTEEFLNENILKEAKEVNNSTHL